ncbi:tRNA 2'-phosphotransferase 1 [Neolecta irregularis DAH-3]|uniref:2'-phosphotransferase n=1 Tax=Neolecta irregularis (strain DAH-3) TaxID=1198029 RepID=A0A1U7LQU7_NEOID|nr:tRNA 2'-phosphotransferase 1 [Neolecta irregularis DAH-3]|eukprot:OLL25046.1 tRNA 2'-phosphotransferase 1 [Neolecta irregularis DAH-3]
MASEAFAKTREKRIETADIKLSKSLSYILRHGALKENLPVRSDGYISLPSILSRPKFKGVQMSDIQRVVEKCEKQRFNLQRENDAWFIRANQGHSIQIDQLDVKPITSADRYPVVLHGTYSSVWPKIQEEGLKVMGRMHIHLATGKFGEAKSGVRRNCSVFIYINLKRALEDGIEFSISENGVVLTKGRHGVLSKEYFEGVEDRNGKVIWPEIVNDQAI